MNRHESVLRAASLALMGLLTATLHAAGQVIPSPGVPGASINLDGVEAMGEWSGAHSFAIDYMNGDPLTANVKALHDATGIYLIVDIHDASTNNNDQLWLRFDLDHSGGGVDTDDWGINVTRDGQATWGELDVDPATWANVPNTEFGTTFDTGSGWVAEVRLPTGSPSGLDLGTGTVGVHFTLYNVELAFNSNSAKYTQWPTPADLNTLPPPEPSEWGDYTFDPATTFADLAVTDVRQGTNPETYRKISSMAPNQFYVRINNPSTGVVLPDAQDVRINLYLAARGIGEPFHRLDAENVLNGDCASPPPATLLTPEPDVCAGTSPHPDISSINLADASQRAALVGGTADYTVFEGVSRFGTSSADPRHTILGGTHDAIHVMDWTLVGGQQDKFAEIVHNSTTYRRQHQCMKAEAIFENDPNPANNTRQSNMDFVCVSALMTTFFPFTLGTAGFGEFEPGKRMFLEVTLENIRPGANWSFDFEGLERIGRNAFMAEFRDERSLPVGLHLTAPEPAVLGTTLKENLVIPPTAGGRRLSEPSGGPPVYVRVRSGSTLLIANYEFDENDVQYVDLDGREGDFPPNGPEGLALPLSRQFGARSVLAAGAPPGALVGSFDNFRTSFTVGSGVQVRVPRDASFLALAINDRNGSYGDNGGSGFRVKVTSLDEGEDIGAAGLGLVRELHAQEAVVQVTPIADVIPTLCLNGYESIRAEQNLGGQPHELYRYIGNVCWAVHNVYPRDRSQEPDRGDPFEEEPVVRPPGGCGFGGSGGFGLSLATVILGLFVVRRRVRGDS